MPCFLKLARVLWRPVQVVWFATSRIRVHCRLRVWLEEMLVLVFSQSRFDLLRCFSDVLFVTVAAGEDISGVASVRYADGSLC